MFEHYNLSETIKKFQPTLIDKVEFVLTDKKDAKSQGCEKIVKKHRIKNFNSSVRRALGNAIRHGGLPVNVETYVSQSQ